MPADYETRRLNFVVSSTTRGGTSESLFSVFKGVDSDSEYNNDSLTISMQENVMYHWCQDSALGQTIIKHKEVYSADDEGDG
jgi:hypothetical protein